MSGGAVLQAEGVAKSYDGRAVIQDVSLTLGRGELVCLLGVSGAGKTTLFHVLSGLERPDRGRVLLEGEDITGVPGKVSYMLQRDLLLPHKKIVDNVSLPLVIRGKRPAQQKKGGRGRNTLWAGRAPVVFPLCRQALRLGSDFSARRAGGGAVP